MVDKVLIVIELPKLGQQHSKGVCGFFHHLERQWRGDFPVANVDLVLTYC